MGASLDFTKSFFYVEDNGDGTTTQTINIPELNVSGSMLVALPLVELMNMFQDIDAGDEKEVIQNATTVIPNNIEEE